jgi:hypothetical protein
VADSDRRKPVISSKRQQITVSAPSQRRKKSERVLRRGRCSNTDFL